MKTRTLITIFILGLILATPVVGEPNVDGGLRLLRAEATATAAAPAGNKLLQGEAAVDKLKEVTREKLAKPKATPTPTAAPAEPSAAMGEGAAPVDPAEEKK